MSPNQQHLTAPESPLEGAFYIDHEKAFHLELREEFCGDAPLPSKPVLIEFYAWEQIGITPFNVAVN